MLAGVQSSFSFQTVLRSSSSGSASLAFVFVALGPRNPEASADVSPGVAPGCPRHCFTVVAIVLSLVLLAFPEKDEYTPLSDAPAPPPPASLASSLTSPSPSTFSPSRSSTTFSPSTAAPSPSTYFICSSPSALTSYHSLSSS